MAAVCTGGVAEFYSLSLEEYHEAFDRLPADVPDALRRRPGGLEDAVRRHLAQAGIHVPAPEGPQETGGALQGLVAIVIALVGGLILGTLAIVVVTSRVGRGMRLCRVAVSVHPFVVPRG